jgi:hypothetical protein
MEALITKEKALTLATLTINTCTSYIISKLRAKKPLDTTIRTPLPATTLPSKSLQLAK